MGDLEYDMVDLHVERGRNCYGGLEYDMVYLPLERGRNCHGGSRV